MTNDALETITRGFIFRPLRIITLTNIFLKVKKIPHFFTPLHSHTLFHKNSTADQNSFKIYFYDQHDSHGINFHLNYQILKA